MTTTPEHTIKALCERSHAISLEKGWVSAEGDPRSFASIASLNHSELSEAFEEYRNNKPLNEIWYEIETVGEGSIRCKTYASQLKEDADLSRCKPCGIPIELADFVIRVAQHVGTSGKSAALEELFNERISDEHYADFDTLIAEAHLAVALAYSSKTMGEGDTAYLAHLTDALREVFAFCKGKGIDLWAAIDQKEAYNRTRPTRHGGKKV
jgi:hypothetical protein